MHMWQSISRTLMVISLELITPLRLDDVENFNEMSLEEWKKR